MKKHPFLKLDFKVTTQISPKDLKKLLKWLEIADLVLQDLFRDKIIPAQEIKSIEISLLVCGDHKMRKLNFEYRNKNKITDVLSFPAHENLRKFKNNFPSLFLGDLAICDPQTLRQSKKFNIGYFDEFIHLFFHGTIHLLGYDHELSNKERALMEKWEQLALEKFSFYKSKRKL